MICRSLLFPHLFPFIVALVGSVRTARCTTNPNPCYRRSCEYYFVVVVSRPPRGPLAVSSGYR